MSSNVQAATGFPVHDVSFAKWMFPQSAPALEEARKRVVGVSDDEVGETYWKVDKGIRLTGMPSFQNNLSSAEMWQVSWLMKSADKPLSPEVQATLNKAESTLP